MTIGNMQYGAQNNSTTDPTSLTSDSPATLTVTNASGGGPAIVGTGQQGHGVAGYSRGCSFPENCVDGAGVYGENLHGGYAIRGYAQGGTGVAGISTGDGTGVSGGSNTGPGVDGNSGAGNGVQGYSAQLNGVQGKSASGLASGVYGENLSGRGYGVAGRSNAPYFPFVGPIGAAVLGDNTVGGWAGLFNGTVQVTGNLFKSGGGFGIDSPVDPANKILQHSFVESPEMLNVYNGNVTTDTEGNATVELPGYFEALNRDYCYQLTAVGQFAQIMVSEEIGNNRFSIKTDKPNVKVSWQVTGIRQDAWANAHRIEVEVDKPEGQTGKYLAPEEHGRPLTEHMYRIDTPEIAEPEPYYRLKEERADGAAPSPDEQN